MEAARTRRSGRTARVVSLRRQIQSGAYQFSEDLLLERLLRALEPSLAPAPSRT
jgi:hypothetical protein